MWKHTTLCRTLRYIKVHCGALLYDVVEAYADTGHHSSPATPQHLLIASLTTPPHPLCPTAPDPSGLQHLCRNTEKIAKKSKDFVKRHKI